MTSDPGARGFSFEIEEAEKPLPNLGRLDLDWSDLAPPVAEVASARAAPNPAAALAAPGSDTPLMPHAAAASRSGAPATAPAKRPLLAALSATDPAPLVPTADAPSPDSPASPVVRRLRFPSAAAPAKPSPRPSTRFADSIGRSRPTADSASDLGVDLGVPPEDLPSRSAAAPEAVEPGLDETPPPALLLRRASALLSSAKSTALDLSGRGLESGRLVAGQMSDALRERLERKLSSHEQAKPEEPPPPSPSLRSAEPEAIHSPRRLPGVGRRSAGPLVALVAALGMFFGSRHLIGGAGVGLSKATPSIPDLGEMPEATAGPRTSTPGPATPAEAPPSRSAPPPPMATELTALPPGMAWPGKGLLEVVTSEDELVYVDGVFTGRGPLRRVPVTPGEHEVSIRKESSVRQGTAKVLVGQTTRAIFRGR